MKCHYIYFVIFSVLIFSRCSDDTSTGPDLSNGPWLGTWLQVNFLTDDDNGVWVGDENSGIGFFLEITDNEWIESTIWEDDDCVVTYSYSVKNGYTYSTKGKETTGSCNFPIPVEQITESGRLEFSDDSLIMITWFDDDQWESILAFKWRRTN